ncbi:hypothetical protein F4775DRAFT_313992 [Biscogniauxia sp. FL1348]|nr:hypothetical protein F4775DRAFT_313992 [Biscogniauxia sp. FL1348]
MSTCPDNPNQSGGNNYSPEPNPHFLDFNQGGLVIPIYGDPVLHNRFITDSNSHASQSSPIKALRLALLSARFDTARILLAEDDAHDLVKRQDDILQIAISSQGAQHLRCSGDAYELAEVLGLLVSHGASVNSLDVVKKSPLYYACACGNPRAFKFLVDSGGDYMAMFDPMPNFDIDMPKSDGLDSAKEGSREANLLDIALEAFVEHEKGSSIHLIRSTPLQVKWGDIVMFLLDAGLAFRADDPRLAKFFQIACFQGNLPYVEKLLELGADQNARPARGHPREEIYGSCLHEAVRAGQRKVVERLLDHGAVASAKRPCTHDFAKPASLELMTPIGKTFATRARRMPADRTVHDVLSCAELLVQSGASEDDCKVVLENSIVEGSTKLALDLINKGIGLQEVPQTENIEIIKVLLARGSALDSPSFQRYAVSKGNVDLLRFLVERDGPLLQLKDFGYIGFDVMRGKKPCFMDMLRYLVTDYGHGMNATFPSYPHSDSHTNFLQRACEENNVSAVRLLLELGADPACPGLRRSAIACVKTRGSGGDGAISRFSRREMLILQALVKHSDSEMQALVAKGIRQHKSQLCPDDSWDSTDTLYGDGPVPSRASVECPIGDAFSEAAPWVEEIAERFQYSPLEADDSIRLVVLEPSNSLEDPIRCRLVEVSLSETPQYETLSCVWRNMGEANIAPISLNGKAFDVPLAVWDALRRVRLNDRDRLIWTDAICINQGHTGEGLDKDEQGRCLDDWVVRERNQQVSHFRNIYRGATQLLVWLGRTEYCSNLVFEHLSRCRDHRHLNWCHYVGETELAYRKLCQRAWFYNAWASQELALSRTTVIMCGIHDCRWSELVKCSCYLPDADYYHPLEGVDGRSHLHHLRGISWGNGVSLRQAILCNRHCKADNPRDKVFGIMGLNVDKQFSIPIDYRASATQVFCEFTQRAIESSKDLAILHWFGPQRHIDDDLSGLPSWVPNFNTPDLIGAFPGIASSGRSFSVHYPSQLLPGFRFPSQRSIAIKGRAVEKVDLLGAELDVSAATRAGRTQFDLILSNWEHIAGQLKATKRFPQAITDAFSDTIVGNDEYDLVIKSDARPFIRKTRPRLSAKADGFDLWYAKYGTGVLREADPDYFEEILTINAWMNVGGEAVSQQEKLRLGDRMVKGQWLRSYTRKMEMNCYGRRFFTTDRGSMGLAPPRALPGDQIVFLPGGRYPFILRARDDGAYEMVGDCFLYDLDVFALFQDEEIETREYVIV